MATQDKIKAVEKEERILKEVAKVFPRSKGLGKYGLYLYEEQKLREAIQLTLKSCSEEISQVELQKEFHWDRIKELEKTIKSLHLQNIDLLADKAEQKAKVEKLKEEIDKLIKNYKAVEVDIGEYDKFISVHKLKEIINKIFSPENHTSKETHRLNTPLGVKPIILDDNEISIMRYAEEFPENWEKICESLENHKLEINSESHSELGKFSGSPSGEHQIMEAFEIDDTEQGK